MPINVLTICTSSLVLIGAVVATPVLYKGFLRRGKGVVYEKNFLIQRAPQYATLVNVVLIVAGFLAANGIIKGTWAEAFSFQKLMPLPLADVIAWFGVCMLTSGLIFMIGGWYSLGECFTTDAEVLDGHKVRKSGLLKFVMHPAYSGIVQSVLGASLAANSLLSIFFAVFVVAPLWLKRAKYEETLLLASLGAEYKAYAEELQWRRFVPRFIPLGV